MSRCIQLKYASVRGHTDLKPATFECLQRKKQVLISNNAGLFKNFGASIFFFYFKKTSSLNCPLTFDDLLLFAELCTVF